MVTMLYNLSFFLNIYKTMTYHADREGEPHEKIATNGHLLAVAMPSLPTQSAFSANIIEVKSALCCCKPK